MLWSINLVSIVLGAASINGLFLGSATASCFLFIRQALNQHVNGPTLQAATTPLTVFFLGEAAVSNDKVHLSVSYSSHHPVPSVYFYLNLSVRKATLVVCLSFQ
jgi:hypothetical protein